VFADHAESLLAHGLGDRFTVEIGGGAKKPVVVAPVGEAVTEIPVHVSDQARHAVDDQAQLSFAVR